MTIENRIDVNDLGFDSISSLFVLVSFINSSFSTASVSSTYTVRIYYNYYPILWCWKQNINSSITEIYFSLEIMYNCWNMSVLFQWNLIKGLKVTIQYWEEIRIDDLQ